MTKSAKIFVIGYLILLAVLVGGVAWMLISDLA